MPAGAEEETSSLSTNPESKQPRIRARFFSAEAVHAFSKLQHLRSEDAEFNKILFKFDNFPANQEIILEIKRQAGPNADKYFPLFNFSLLDDGTILMQDQQRLNALIMSSKGFLPGERVFFRARTTDWSVSKEISGILVPAIFRDDQGKIAIKAELFSVSPTVYAIDLPQMTDGEEYQLKSQSIGATVKAKPKYNKAKPFHYSPETGKNRGGDSILEIRRKSGELYVIKLPWGAALDPYLNGQKTYSFDH
jgi:hypothetical protein